MVFFNYTTMEMSAKIVYYGPGLCGKTTNLQYIYNHIPKTRRGEMVSLPTETDRTLFFDLLPLRLGKIGGFTTRLQLYTVPGQVFYNSTRKLVLKGVDSIVFVADSQVPILDANIESLENLQENLAELKLNLRKIPWVIQYNKRDLPRIMSIDELNKHMNFMNVPWFEASAITGSGVIETLKGISKLTLQALKRKAGYSTIEKPPGSQQELDQEEDEEDVHIGVDNESEAPAKEAAPAPAPKAAVQAPEQKKPIVLESKPKDKPEPVKEPKREKLSWVPEEKRKQVVKEIVKTIRIPIDLSQEATPDLIHLKLNLQIDLNLGKSTPTTGNDEGAERMSAPLEKSGWAKER